MREILFRGKILGLTDWAYGYYAKSGENHFILLDTDNEDNYSIVDPETVGQFTGLCDKNGKKIFEGDILKVYETQEHAQNVSVSYENGQFVVSHYALKLLSDRALQSEVIGNVHDNPNFWRTDLWTRGY